MKKSIAIVLMLAFVVVLACPVFASGEPAASQANADASAVAADAQFTYEDVVAPTCAEKGLRVWTDSVSGYTFTQELPPTGNHSYVASVKAATCTEDGAITYTCSVCGDSYTETVPATGHVPSAAAATCTESVVCTVCGTVLSAATGHNYVYQYDAVQNADGSFASFGTWKCEVCGDVIDATEGNAAYYYAQPEEEPAPAASDEASGEPSEAPSEEEPAAEEEAASNPNYDPAAHNWASIEIIMVIIILVVGAVLMLSFGKKKDV